MPYGNVYCDTKLMDSNEIRMLRRIVRDFRHRSAHAIATIDYWPMIQRSEEKYYEEYLTCADYHVNSFLAYESLIIAPMAMGDIKEALDKAVLCQDALLILGSDFAIIFTEPMKGGTEKYLLSDD